jgi:uncharacterized membrane protein
VSYTFLKAIHVLAVILFTGNIVVTAVWKILADRTRDARIVRFGQRLVTVTDVFLTGPGALLVLATGLLMMQELGAAAMKLRWIHMGLGLFVVSGLLWGACLVPIQRKQSRILRSLKDGEPVPESYWRLGRWWMVLGSVAALLPLVNVVLMVFKPV